MYLVNSFSSINVELCICQHVAISGTKVCHRNHINHSIYISTSHKNSFNSLATWMGFSVIWLMVSIISGELLQKINSAGYQCHVAWMCLEDLAQQITQWWTSSYSEAQSMRISRGALFHGKIKLYFFYSSVTMNQ